MRFNSHDNYKSVVNSRLLWRCLYATITMHHPIYLDKNVNDIWIDSFSEYEHSNQFTPILEDNYPLLGDYNFPVIQPYRFSETINI